MDCCQTSTCCCCTAYNVEPTEFCLAQKKINSIASNERFKNTVIQIDGDTFKIQWTTDPNGNKILIITEPPADQEKGFVLQSLFNGKTISIDINNAVFVKRVAEFFELYDLKEVCQKYIDNGKIEPGLKSASCKTLSWIRSLLRHFGTVTKFFFTLWDLIGVAFILGFFCNIIILLATTGLSTIVNNPALFIFVILPFLLFSIYFVNLMIIAVLEFFKFRIFLVKSPFTSIQVLIMKLLKVWGIKKPYVREYMDLGYVYDVFMGLLLVIFFILFGSQMISTKAAYLVELFIFIFAVIIPPLRYILVILLYTLHAYSGLFRKCKDRFNEIDDFSDFILNAIYLRDHCYHDLFNAIKGKVGVQDVAPADQNDRATATTEIDLPDIQQEQARETVVEYLAPEKNELDGMTRKRIILRGIFSRSTFAIYVFVSVLIYVIYNAVTSSVTVGQIIVLLVIFGFILVPMATWISFPFFWIGRARENSRTERSLVREKENLETTKAYKRYTHNFMLWSHDAVILRWSSFMLSFIVIFFLFLYVFASLAFVSNPNVFRADEVEYNSSVKRALEEPLDVNENEGFRITRNPICDYRLKNLSSQQLLALADASYYDTAPRWNKKILILKEYFGENYESLIEEINTTIFPDPIYNCSLTHFKIKEKKLIIFSIKGTKNLNDILADAELWIGSIIFDVLMQYTPLVEMYAAASRSYLGLLLSLPRYVFKQFSLVEKYVTKYHDYIKSIDIPDDYDVILTGHSLGGGIAKILSFMTGWQAVAVSGPGVSCVESIYKSSKYKNIGNTFVNINPGQDFVAMIDSISDSTEFKVPCRSGIMKCHSSVRTLCQTGVICGDEKLHEAYCRLGFPGSQYDDMVNLKTYVDMKVK